MKKFISVLLAGALCLSMAGCGGSTGSDGTDSTEATTAAQAAESASGEKYTIGIAQFAEHGSLDNCREGFIEGLKEAGLEEGVDFEIDYQNAQADMANTNQIAQTMVANGEKLICAIATPMAQACYNAAEGKDIPVIYTAVTDPVAAQLANEDGSGLGNATGTSDKLAVEAQLQMIRDFMPDAKNIGILYSTSETNSVSAIAEYKELAPSFGFTIVESGISQGADIPMAAADLCTKVDCISNLTDNTVVSNLQTVLDAANKAQIPVFGSEIEQVKNGCVATEGLDYVALGKQTGAMAARVLGGESAQSIPFETISEYSLYINSGALRTLNMSCPEALAGSAQEVGAQ